MLATPRKAFNDAIKNKLIKENPFNDIESPKAANYIAYALGISQVKEMLLGLKETEIFVNKTLTSSKGGYMLSQTKTQSSTRTIPISDTVIKILESVKMQQVQDKLLLGSSYNDDDFICAKADGSPLSTSSFNKKFSKELKRLNFRHFRIHDLRHTYISIMRRFGVCNKTVGELCGHVNFNEMTDEIYTHINESDKIEASSIMGEQLKFLLY